MRTLRSPLMATALLMLFTISAMAQEVSGTVVVECFGDPETVDVYTTGTGSFVVDSIASLDDPRGNEVFDVNAELGEEVGTLSVGFSAGKNAGIDPLTRRLIFDDEAAGEGVRVVINTGGQTITVEVTCEEGETSFAVPSGGPPDNQQGGAKPTVPDNQQTDGGNDTGAGDGLQGGVKPTAPDNQQTGAGKTPDNQQGDGREWVTVTFELTLTGDVPEDELADVEFKSSDESGTTVDFFCGPEEWTGEEELCEADTYTSLPYQVLAGTEISYAFTASDPPDDPDGSFEDSFTEKGVETLTESMVIRATFDYGGEKQDDAPDGDEQKEDDKDTRAGDDQQTPDNQQTGGGKDTETDAGDDEQDDAQHDGTGAGNEQEMPDNQQTGGGNDTDTRAGDDVRDDTQDDQQVEVPEEMPVTGAGGLAAGVTIPVGNAAAGLTMLVGAGYAVVRRR